MKLRRTSFELAPAGTHPARVTAIVDLGLQEFTWQGTTRRRHLMGITFELANKRTKDGQPFAIFERVTMSLHEASKLTGIVEACLGNPGPSEVDPADLLGRAVLVSVAHRESGGRTYANVSHVSPIPDGMAVPETTTPLRLFDLDHPDPAVFAKLPALYRKLIENRVRPPERGSSEDADMDENPPF